MFAAIWHGYKDGVRRGSVQAGPALYGNVISDRVRGVDVLELWPVDFPLSAREGNPTVQPLGRLWRPCFSGVFDIAIAYSGLEEVGRRGGRRWLLQRWFIQPMSRRGIEIARAYDRNDLAAVQQLVREGDDEALQRQQAA